MLLAGRGLAVDERGEPRPRPRRRGRVARAGRVQLAGGFVQPALVDVHAGEVQVPVRHRVFLAEREQLLERLFRLLELAALAAAFEEAADAVVVPPLPRRLDRRRLRRHRRARARHRQRHLVLAHVYDGQLRRLLPPVNELHVLVVELAVAHLRREFDRGGERRGHVDAVVHHGRRTGADLLVVQRGEDVLRVAAVDAVAVAVEHVDVDEVRPRIDRPGVVRVRGRAVASDLQPARRRAEVHPDFVRVNGPL